MNYFLLGMFEFRHAMTTRVSEDNMETYDKGREFAHKITLRFYDER